MTEDIKEIIDASGTVFEQALIRQIQDLEQNKHQIDALVKEAYALIERYKES